GRPGQSLSGQRSTRADRTKGLNDSSERVAAAPHTVPTVGRLLRINAWAAFLPSQTIGISPSARSLSNRPRYKGKAVAWRPSRPLVPSGDSHHICLVGFFLSGSIPSIRT